MAKKTKLVEKGIHKGKIPKTLHFTPTCVRIIDVIAASKGTDFKNYVQDLAENDALKTN